MVGIGAVWGAITMMAEWMSKEERILTPPEFAEYLVYWVRRLTGKSMIAALYVAEYGHYPRMRNVVSYPILAQYYTGPHPVIAHPPCGPWGKMKGLCKYQDKSLGPRAICQVHLHGGVVEQPLGSSLFREYGRPGAMITRLNQCDYGHRAEKATLLYWCVP